MISYKKRKQPQLGWIWSHQFAIQETFKDCVNLQTDVR